MFVWGDGFWGERGRRASKAGDKELAVCRDKKRQRLARSNISDWQNWQVQATICKVSL